MDADARSHGPAAVEGRFAPRGVSAVESTASELLPAVAEPLVAPV